MDAGVAARSFVRARVRDVLACEPGFRVVDKGMSVLFRPFFLLGRELRGAEVRVVPQGKPCDRKTSVLRSWSIVAPFGGRSFIIS